MPDPDPEDFGIPGDGDGDGEDPGDEDGPPESGDEDGDTTQPDECFTVVDSLKIDDNTHFESVNCIEHVLGDLTIGATKDLLDLGLLSNLRQVDGTLLIVANDSIQNLTGLDSLERVNALELYRNKSISSLIGASSLTALHRLVVSDHVNITNLTGLPDGLSPAELVIDKNPKLPTLDGLPSFVPAPDGDPLHATVRYNNELISLDGLSACCASQPISLVVQRNRALTDLDGLEAFTELTTLELYDNFAMQDLDGIDQLTEVGTLHIEYDPCIPGEEPSMLDLGGAESLTQIDVLHLEWVSSLTTLAGLHNVTTLSKLSLSNSPELPQGEVEDFIAQTQVQPYEVCGTLGSPMCDVESCPMTFN